jgi:integration host factor subunit beta
MTKSELIEQMSDKYNDLPISDVKLAVETLLEAMVKTLESNDRVEIRGFGSFALNYQAPRMTRNPRTGEAVPKEAKHKVHFKAGKELKDRVNKNK